MQGTVLWFNNKKGYGFIRTDDIKQDIFVHFSDIEMTGYKKLSDGAKVNFELARRDNKYCAIKVKSN